MDYKQVIDQLKDKYDFHILSEERTHFFGNFIITLENSDVFLRIVNDRDFLSLEIAAKEYKIWYGIPFIELLVHEKKDLDSILTFHQTVDFLMDNYNLLKSLFSTENFPGLKRRMDGLMSKRREQLIRNNHWVTVESMVDKAIKFENDGEIDKALAGLENIIKIDPFKADNWIRYLFDAWYVLLEPDFDHLDINKELLEKNLKKYFKEAYKRFSGNPEFLFYMGYIMSISSWYFVDPNEVDGDQMAVEMIQRAHELEPDNIIYRWCAKYNQLDDSLNDIQKEERSQLFEEVKKSDLWISGGLIGKYFDEVVKNSKREY
jgi:tetratricopeptide (TPR) repeat protein